MYDTHLEHVYLCLYTHHIQERVGNNGDKIMGYLFNHRTSGFHYHSVIFTVTCWELSRVEYILLPLGNQAQERFSGVTCELLEAARRLKCQFLCAALGLQSQVNKWPCKWYLWPTITETHLSPSASFQQVTGTAKRCLQWPKDREIESVCDSPSQCILSVSDVQNYAFVSALMAVNPFYTNMFLWLGEYLVGKA